MDGYKTLSATMDGALRTSPEPMDPERRGYSALATEKEQGHGVSDSVSPLASAIRHNSAPIHHHIAPALGAPFMSSEGLVHRGMKDSLLKAAWIDGRTFGASVSGWDGKSCACAVEVAWRWHCYDSYASPGNWGQWLMVEPTWDSSSDTSYSPEIGRDSSNSTRSASPSTIIDGDVKLVQGGQTFILTHDNQRKYSTNRRQSGHRKEFHNVSIHHEFSSPSCHSISLRPRYSV